MAVATRAKSASKPAAKTAKVKPVKDVRVDLPADAGKILSDLFEARAAKTAADTAEKAAKAKLEQLLPKRKKNTRLVLWVRGEIRAKVSGRKRTGDIDKDLLMAGWPEAFDACKRADTEYEVINS